MFKMIGVCAIAMVVSTGAHAQSADPSADQPMPPRAGPSELPTPSGMPSDEIAGKSENRLDADEDMHSRMRGARIHIEDRGMVIDMRCPAGDDLKDCSDLVLQVLDRLQGGGQSDGTDRQSDNRDRPRYRY